MSRTTEHEINFGPSPPPVESVVPPVSRTAQLLALAIRFERLLQPGEVASMAEIARRYEISNSRVSQILNLTNLAPHIQEKILLGIVDAPERSIRQPAAQLDWRSQSV